MGSHLKVKDSDVLILALWMGLRILVGVPVLKQPVFVNTRLSTQVPRPGKEMTTDSAAKSKN